MYFQQSDAVKAHDGFPNPVTDSSLQNIDLNRLLIRNGASTFFMQIDGNNWAGQGIFAGDLALVDRAMQPKPNDPVVWMRDDKFDLLPCHKLPIEAEAWGVVTTIIHRYRNVGL